MPLLKEPKPQLFDLNADPSEQVDVAAMYPQVVSLLQTKYDHWFKDVMTDWNRSRARILAHDRAYWNNRKPPDAPVLFQDYWQWQKAERQVDPATSDPLTTFRGFWTNDSSH